MGAHHPHIPPAAAAAPTTARRVCPSTTRPTTAVSTPPSDTHSNGTAEAGETIGRVADASLWPAGLGISPACYGRAPGGLDVRPDRVTSGTALSGALLGGRAVIHRTGLPVPVVARLPAWAGREAHC